MDETALALPHVSLRRRNLLHAAAALILIAAAPPAFIAVALVTGLLPLAALSPLSLLAGLLLWSKNPSPRERLGRLDAGELGLFFNGRRLLSRSGVLAGRVVPDPGEAPIVLLSTRRGPLEIRVSHPLAAEALLHALGIDTSRPREARLASRVVSDPTSFAQVTLAAATLPLLFGAVGLLSHAHPFLCAALGALTLTVTLVVLVALTAPTRIAVGEGSLTVTWLGRRRLLRYDEVDDVRLVDESRGAFGRRGGKRGLSIFLRSGEALRFALEEGEGDAEAVVEGLREQMGSRPLVRGYREAVAELVE